MTVTEMKHQARLEEWREKILDCRSSGVGVKQWCAERHVTPTTYYRWEREIFGKVQKCKDGELALVPTATFAELPALAAQETQFRSTPASSALVASARIDNATVDFYAGVDADVVEALCKLLRYVK